jgi:hypothetical protein
LSSLKSTPHDFCRWEVYSRTGLVQHAKIGGDTMAKKKGLKANAKKKDTGKKKGKKK